MPARWGSKPSRSPTRASRSSSHRSGLSPPAFGVAPRAGGPLPLHPPGATSAGRRRPPCRRIPAALLGPAVPRARGKEDLASGQVVGLTELPFGVQLTTRLHNCPTKAVDLGSRDDLAGRDLRLSVGEGALGQRDEPF